MPAGMTANDFVQKRTRLFAIYDELAPAFGRQQPSVASHAPLAREFLKLFDALHEPPLKPYYQAAGQAFFDWVRATAA